MVAALLSAPQPRRRGSSPPPPPSGRRLALLALAILSLALLLQTTDSREGPPSGRSQARKLLHSRRPVRSVSDSDSGDDDDPVTSSSRSAPVAQDARTPSGGDDALETTTAPEPDEPQPSAADNRSGEPAGSDESDGDERSSSNSKTLSDFDTAAFDRLFKGQRRGPVANPNSGVEKGTETELPKLADTHVGRSKGPSGGKGAHTGVIVHSDNPAAKAEKSTAESNASAQTTASPATPVPARKVAGNESATEDVEEGERENADGEGGDSSAEGDSDDADESRASGSGIKSGAAPAADTAKPAVDSNSTLVELVGNATAKAKANVINASLNDTTIFKVSDDSKKAASKFNSTEKLMKGIAKLGAKSEALTSRRNTTIIINGRKFDQVLSVDCVDGTFYRMLMDDLGLINPALRRDFYGTYYDSEYAKAIGAIVDTPQVQGKEENEGKPTTHAESILDEIRKFWNETRATYVAHRVNLGPGFGGMGGAASIRRLKRAPNNKLPKHQAALANYRYLLERLEQLKLMLMNGEEALVVLNNRVKKLNQVPTEQEIHGALCSCITSRGGRAALSAMNELFVDKESAKLMSKPELGKRRGEAAARDVAEFCAFWYGDTLRSEAVQKEKQIKKLVIKMAKRKITKKKHTTTITETKITQDGNGLTKREVHTKVVTAIVQMTELWMPKLAKWIKTTLDVVGQNVTEDKPVIEEFSSSPQREDEIHQSRTRRSRAAEADSSFFSTPFDAESNYADLERPAHFESVALMGGGRKRRSAFRVPKAFKARARSTTVRPPVGQAAKNNGRSTTTVNPKLLIHAPMTQLHSGVSTTPAPQATSATPEASQTAKETDFESRISARSIECAKHGFAELISVGFEQNALMYESNVIKRDDRYIVAFRDAFVSSFPVHWRDRRDHWSKSMAADSGATETGGAPNKPAAASNPPGSGSEAAKSDSSQHDKGRSVDEEIDDSLGGDDGGAYERGARLGFTVGKFIGDKSANQWPDPAELNTFTYDSLFLAGIGHGYTEEDSRLLERRIVTETAKRVAFSESNRQAFAKTLHTAYLNGAHIVPQWGVLHAQRAVSKQAAKEGAKTGFDAASKAVGEFMPRANKFFLNHQHQRALAAPYKAPLKSTLKAPTSAGGAHDKWAGVHEQVEQVKREGELTRNISDAAVECGHRSGAVMGALVGLVVAPEAFETYMRIRGSLEAFENEFNAFKLGAMRGYELGETWAQLNYTVTMQQNLQAMKAQMASLSDGLHLSSLSGGGNYTTSGNKTAKAARAKLDKLSGESLFESKQQQALEGVSANQMDTNNVFQYMVLNYGSHLVANHSRQSMLKFRGFSMDDNLLRDMKIQSGDLIAEPSAAQLSSPDVDDGDELFEGGHYIGELKGQFNSRDNSRKVPLKFNIIDLGPVLELQDETQAPVRGSTHVNSLETTPLTSSLAKVGKIFMKFSVARRKRHPSKSDQVARFLNSGPNGFDEGDGYLCGTYSQLTTHLPDGTSIQSHQALQEDDFSTEVSILDELFERIEGASLRMGSTVSMVESVMGVTTAAPKRVESVADSGGSSKSQTASPKSQVRHHSNSTSRAPAKSRSEQPTASEATTSEPSGGNSRSAAAAAATDDYNDNDDYEADEGRNSNDDATES